MKQLEKPLDDAFKKLPQLPENARAGLASVVPWMALAGAVLSLWSALSLYRIASYVDSIYSSFGYMPTAPGVASIVWIGIAILIVEGILFLVAFPALRNYKKSGWNLLFWVALVSVFYGVIMNMFNGYFDIGQLIVSLLGAGIGLYLLFQIRPYYTDAGNTKPISVEPKSPVVKTEIPTEKTDKEA